ncbi:MAG: RNA ligase RtcB family protein [Hyphomicrobiaceae bacterium]|nr:RNA ligase RtcB family protein [Hyphomicrobiaceae bacterium]
MGNSLSVDGTAAVHMFTSSAAWIEGDATRQLQEVAKLDGVTAVAAMPDLHPGKYGPVGCAVLAGLIHPGLIGADIGCGMGLFALDVAARRLRADKVADRLRALGGAWSGDALARVEDMGLAASAYDGSLGTIGGGNHFCELQVVDEIIDPEAAGRAGIDAEGAYLLVHSGSRGLGYAVLEGLLAGGLQSLDPASDAGHAYLAAHDHAVRWAVLNRRIIAERAAGALRLDMQLVNDVGHNLAEVTGNGILHRKGAASANRGFVPVPGSRGALSYLVEPVAHAPEESLASLAHGAGRKYERGSMHGRVGAKKSDLARLQRNRFGGVVVCEDRNLLIEEAPEAYKAIGQVIEDLTQFGLARVVATFRPLVTFKSVKETLGAVDASRQSRDKNRREKAEGRLRRKAREDWR